MKHDIDRDELEALFLNNMPELTSMCSGCGSPKVRLMHMDEMESKVRGVFECGDCGEEVLEVVIE